VLFLPLLDRENSSAKVSELGFLLDGLEPFMALAVGNQSLCFILAPTPCKPILVVQLLKVCDLVAETPDLFSKDFNVIQAYQNSASRRNWASVR
jgi:hypothetical protein